MRNSPRNENRALLPCTVKAGQRRGWRQLSSRGREGAGGEGRGETGRGQTTTPLGLTESLPTPSAYLSDPYPLSDFSPLSLETFCSQSTPPLLRDCGARSAADLTCTAGSPIRSLPTLPAERARPPCHWGYPLSRVSCSGDTVVGAHPARHVVVPRVDRATSSSHRHRHPHSTRTSSLVALAASPTSPVYGVSGKSTRRGTRLVSLDPYLKPIGP